MKKITREEFLEEAKTVKELNPKYRWGQAVFNYADEYLGVARYVQFEKNIDCFYRDDMVNKFIDEAIIAYNDFVEKENNDKL